MDGKSSLTVLFEAPFWVGVLERWEAEGYSACKITFGAEPKDYEVYEFLQKNWNHLEYSTPVPEAPAPERKINPKRLQRAIQAQTKQTGIGTKAQQALSRQREENKLQRRERSKEEREAEQARRYALRQEKRREKHRGR